MNTLSIPERLHARLTSHLREKGLRLINTVVPVGWEPYDMMVQLAWEDGAAPLKVIKPEPST